MRYPASEKLEIIRIVEQSHLSARKTLDKLGTYLCEMIQVDAASKNRAVTWQWFRGGKCYMRTLIDEHFITSDWQNWTNFEAPQS